MPSAYFCFETLSDAADQADLELADIYLLLPLGC